jgi:hypothetical protein
VDEWLLHGPSCEKTSWALSAFVDLVVQVGLLCHPNKPIQPCQSVKYCGYIYNATGIPTLLILSDKRDRALAMVQWVLSNCVGQTSPLALLVVIGVLQSLVAATPSNVGQTMLNSVCDLLHDTVDSNPRQKFYSRAFLMRESHRDVNWWLLAVSLNVCHPV